MEICITKRYEDDELARSLIEMAQSDETTVEEYAEIAVDAATILHSKSDCCVEVINASARIAENEDSGDLDVLIMTTAMTYGGFYIVKAWLSDIKKLADGSQKEIAAKMDVRYFKETK